MPELPAADCFAIDSSHTAVPNNWLFDLAEFKIHYDLVLGLQENEDE